jgi:drug/metabolite transporter (DMT)-like permease
MPFSFKHSPLRWLHVLIGFTGIIIFLNTGQFMDKELGHLRGMELGPRALYRSAHIYILFASLLHLMLGAYLNQSKKIFKVALQMAASLMLLIALGLFVWSFYTETDLQLIERPKIRLGIYLSAASTITHVIVDLADTPTSKKQDVQKLKSHLSTSVKQTSASDY